MGRHIYLILNYILLIQISTEKMSNDAQVKWEDDRMIGNQEDNFQNNKCRLQEYFAKIYIEYWMMIQKMKTKKSN